ncbi:MAG: hypothetical protein AUK47_10665 [Deltaproteobacteria bacterium CG2_30_63_29]|nr:MAG: hypothetical protein AUK47_10665 [Deltaproteobacteria bacterium CG2_30_63_29]
MHQPYAKPPWRGNLSIPLAEGQADGGFLFLAADRQTSKSMWIPVERSQLPLSIERIVAQ